MSDHHLPDARFPRSEPEIIPPAHAGRTRGIWVFEDQQGGARRIYVARPGPFAIVLALSVLGLCAVLALIILLSLAVVWIPVVIVLIVAFMASMYWRRFRLWLARR